MASGKMLRISENRSIYILEDEFGNYISNEMEISYKNVGKDYDVHFIQTHPIRINEKNMIEILDNVGNPMFFFPSIWLNTDQMKIMSLIEKGLLQTKT